MDQIEDEPESTPWSNSPRPCTITRTTQLAALAKALTRTPQTLLLNC